MPFHYVVYFLFRKNFVQRGKLIQNTDFLVNNYIQSIQVLKVRVFKWLQVKQEATSLTWETSSNWQRYDYIYIIYSPSSLGGENCGLSIWINVNPLHPGMPRHYFPL